MTKLDWLLVTSVWIVLCVVVFIGGVFLAYQLDVATSKAPDVWAEQRELKNVMEDNNLPINGTGNQL